MKCAFCDTVYITNNKLMVAQVSKLLELVTEGTCDGP